MLIELVLVAAAGKLRLVGKAALVGRGLPVFRTLDAPVALGPNGTDSL